MKHFRLILLVAFCAAISVSAVAQRRVLGADLSMLPVYEQAGVVYKDAAGVAQTDPLLFFRDVAGVRCVRLRLFVEPTGETGVVQDLEYVTAFARRIKQAGMGFMLDFHYSDTWADPEKQYIPRAWPTDAEGIARHIYDHTSTALRTLLAADAAPDYIQVGNEISYGLCSMTATYAGGRWTRTDTPYAAYTSSDAGWATLRSFLDAGVRACRELCPAAKIVIHTERAGQLAVARGFYERIASVDYDIIGLSYYPFWHNSLSVLAATLDGLATSFPTKEVMIVEAAYNNAWYPSGSGIYDFQSLWPASPQGQRQFCEDLIAELRRHPHVTGLFYWMPEENPFGNHVYEPWLNRGLFANGNASVGQSDGGCALPALYSLRRFTEGQEDAIRAPRPAAIPASASSAAFVYDLGGRPAGHKPADVAVGQGRKFIPQKNNP